MERELTTRCLHLSEEEELRELEQSHGSLGLPIYQTATFAHVGDDPYAYSRESNPTRDHVEKIVCQLEHGADCVALSSGMSAIRLVLELFQTGDVLLVDDDLYGGSVRLFAHEEERTGIVVKRKSFSKDPTVEPGVKFVYLETPTNPMMHITDLRALSRSAHEAGALVIVDNTFLSPYFQNPLELGADIVIHSGTKFLCGHHDALGGFVITKDPELAKRLRGLLMATGAVLAPQDAFLISRGIQTLALRMERSEQNALAVAKWLQDRPEVTKVLYPGLPEHPGHAIMKEQARGYGAVISFELESAEQAASLLRHFHLIQFAESLGGTASLITYPIVQTHADVPEYICKENGLTDRLLRLSIGIEGEKDLLADFTRAFEESKEE